MSHEGAGVCGPWGRSSYAAAVGSKGGQTLLALGRGSETEPVSWVQKQKTASLRGCATRTTEDSDSGGVLDHRY